MEATVTCGLNIGILIKAVYQCGQIAQAVSDALVISFCQAGDVGLLHC